MLVSNDDTLYGRGWITGNQSLVDQAAAKSEAPTRAVVSREQSLALMICCVVFSKCTYWASPTRAWSSCASSGDLLLHIWQACNARLGFWSGTLRVSGVLGIQFFFISSGLGVSPGFCRIGLRHVIGRGRQALCYRSSIIAYCYTKLTLRYYYTSEKAVR